MGRRLKDARQEVGLSTRKVCEKLPKRINLSHTRLATFENGEASVPIDVLTALASIYDRPLNWFLESSKSLSGFRYRNLRSRVKVKEKRQFEALATKWAEAYFRLEQRLNKPLKVRSTFRKMDVDPDTPPRDLATKVRGMLGLDDDQPVLNVIDDVVHAFGVRVMEAESPLAIDGVAARRGRDFVVVLNRDTTSDRLRLNAAHELAHALYDDCKEDNGWSDEFVEQRAYEFGSHLLLPDKALDAALKRKSFIRLIEFKKRYGISLAAMIYRAEKSGKIKTTTARWLWMNMAQRGWRKKEPGLVWRERAIRFEELLDAAIHSKELTWSEAESVTGITESTLKQRLQEAAGLCDPDGEGENEPQVLRIET
ncbi:MAG: ImmA/IrrE family metallo-endopeptidase [Planctomycetaceae bacterium]|nr:ImmA/IrrE family metallo-endopeptidase [Planctomycetaceae bacterium]